MNETKLSKWLEENGYLDQKLEQDEDLYRVPNNPANVTGWILQERLSPAPIRRYQITPEGIFYKKTNSTDHMLPEKVARELAFIELFGIDPLAGSFSNYRGGLKTVDFSPLLKFSLTSQNSLFAHYRSQEINFIKQRYLRNAEIVDTFLEVLRESPDPYPKYAAVVRVALDKLLGAKE